jgi:hypothetical protein
VGSVGLSAHFVDAHAKSPQQAWFVVQSLMAFGFSSQMQSMQVSPSVLVG